MSVNTEEYTEKNLIQLFLQDCQNKFPEDALKDTFVEIDNSTKPLLDGTLARLSKDQKFIYLEFLVKYAVNTFSKKNHDIYTSLNDITKPKQDLSQALNTIINVDEKIKIIKIIILLHTMHLLKKKDNNLSRALIAAMVLTTANFLGLTGALIFAATKLYALFVSRKVLGLGLSVSAVTTGVALILLLTSIVVYFLYKYKKASEKIILDNIKDTTTWMQQKNSHGSDAEVAGKNHNVSSINKVSVFSDKLNDFMLEAKNEVMNMISPSQTQA